jgi:putative endonuclease
MNEGFVYIMSNQSRTLYTGVTSDLEQRIWQHKNKVFKGFTEKYNLTKLVWFQAFDDISTAIEYEKKVKAWRREKRVALIEEKNPRWDDLAENWFAVERILPMNPDPSVGEPPSG